MKKLLMLLVATFVIVMSLKAQNFDTEKVLRHLNRAEVCIEMNKIDDAIKEYQEIVKIAPNWSNVYMYLGNSYSLKDDDISLSKSIEYYNKFLQMTDDQELYIEAKDRLSRVEMVRELKAKETKRHAQLLGTWKTSLHDKYTGRPWFIINITKTPIQNQYQITLSPKSFMYNNIINTKAYSEIIDDEITWMITYLETYIPSQVKHNARGMLLNMLAGDNNVAAAVASVVNESIRESDVGYTDINEFRFGCNVNTLYADNKKFSIGYMSGFCSLKGEHHENGKNQVIVDSVFHCDFIKGDENFPIMVKISKIGRKYYYGDIKLSKTTPIYKYSPYISKSDYERQQGKMKILGLYAGLTTPALCMLGAGLGVMSDAKDNTSKHNLGMGLFTAGCLSTGFLLYKFVQTNHRWNAFLRKCYENHNKKVDENIKKYGNNFESRVTFDVGLSPFGAGIIMNF